MTVLELKPCACGRLDRHLRTDKCTPPDAEYPEVECGYCGALYRHSPRTKPICNSCLADAGF